MRPWARVGICKLTSILSPYRDNLSYSSLTSPLPRRRLDGCACTSPLAHFYIHHSDSSVRELHPFTTITHLASQNTITDPKEDNIHIQFLFRTRGIEKPVIDPEGKHGFAPAMFSIIRRLRSQKSPSQWTNRLAGVTSDYEAGGPAVNSVVEHINTRTSPLRSTRDVPVSLRLEGPYFTPADPRCYRTVVCLVAGTGISGALAISGAFKELERQSTTRKDVDARLPDLRYSVERQRGIPTSSSKFPTKSVSADRIWKRCIVLWSVREDTHIDLPMLESNQPPVSQFIPITESSAQIPQPRLLM